MVGFVIWLTVKQPQVFMVYNYIKDKTIAVLTGKKRLESKGLATCGGHNGVNR